ncbi:hypothetical protein Pelo_17796 [Pelomyxa schiedti]|nr:hypothetical protein Pelo_17796 [Pelomyxa schiedti]
MASHTTPSTSFLRCRGGDVRVYDQTDARAQFVSLAAGAIVGRCGGNWSALSILTPPMLTLLGREWVVFPRLRPVVLLTTRNNGRKVPPQTQYVMFSVSPTLGLVDYPCVLDLGLQSEFRGWVGPTSSLVHRPHDHYGWLHGRFAFVNSSYNLNGLSFSLKVIYMDVSGNEDVATIMIMKNRKTWPEIWKHNWKWGVLVEKMEMSLWNFEVPVEEPGGDVKKVQEMPLPWTHRVTSLVFDGTDLLVVMLAAQPTQQMVITVDLTATWEQQRVVISHTQTAFNGKSIEATWCWRGNVYTTTCDCALCCITTGQVTTSHKGNEVMKPIGGPYFTTRLYPRGSPTMVYSVEEPTKLCHRHAVERHGSIHFAHELGVREPVCAKKNRYIEVVDAVSGFSVFKMRTEAGFHVMDGKNGESPTSGRCRGEVRVYDQTDARAQFVALAAGAIVGRCGGNWSALSILTPSMLTLIGREWVVFPRLRPVVVLASVNNGRKMSPQTQYVMFSVSPTLGLVNHPSLVDLGLQSELLGPTHDHYGRRRQFAFVNDFESGSWVPYNFRVIDIDAPGNDVETIIKTGRSWPEVWKNNWKWGVIVDTPGKVMSLWNFELLVEDSGGVTSW